MVYKRFKIHKIILGILCFPIIFVMVENVQVKDSIENTELIFQRVGSNITLTCNRRGLIKEPKSEGIQYFWYFKPCGRNSGNCFGNGYVEEWTQLACEDSFCRSTLHLKNVTENNSGLYKCSTVPKKTKNLNIRYERTFQLDITNAPHKLPVFLEEEPLNQSIALGSQAVFRCRVYSDEHFTIKWFRRLPTSNSYIKGINNKSIVYYNGQAYNLLTTPKKRPIGSDVYLSKLILNNVRYDDGGFYACVAINLRGHIIREAYLKIYSPAVEQSPEYWSDYSEEIVGDPFTHSDPKEFWILFLIPVGLALLPISLWIFYVTHKRCQDQVKFPVQLASTTDEQRMIGALYE